MNLTTKQMRIGTMPSLTVGFAEKLADYVSRGKHPLHPPQVKTFGDIVTHLNAGHTYGYVKRPTGTGKTVIYAAEIEALQTPAVIVTPRTNLTTQIQKTFLNRDLFDFDPESVGIYNPNSTEKEQSAALKSPTLITTFASFIRLAKRGDLQIKKYPILILDEVHHA